MSFDPKVRPAAVACCVGKEAFETGNVARAVNKRRARKGMTGDVYRCPHCSKYHIGRRWHTRPEKDRARASDMREEFA